MTTCGGCFAGERGYIATSMMRRNITRFFNHPEMQGLSCRTSLALERALVQVQSAILSTACKSGYEIRRRLRKRQLSSTTASIDDTPQPLD